MEWLLHIASSPDLCVSSRFCIRCCVQGLWLTLLTISGDDLDESYASMGYGSDFEDFLEEFED